MIGFTYAIVAALLFAVSEASKKYLTKKINIFFIFWAMTALALPVFIIGLSIDGIPEIDATFWLVLIFAVPLFLFSSLLLIKAEAISPLSLTVPYLSFTPVFLILTSWLLLKEMPNTYGIIGIILIVIGSFLLHAKDIKKGLSAPILAIKKEKGSLYVLVVAFIWAITSNLDKICVQHSSPNFYLFMINAFEAVILTIILLTKYRSSFKEEFKNNFKLLGILGLNIGLAALFQMLAVKQILVAYTIAIKRAGLVLGAVIFGYLIFKEKEFRYRLLAGLIMVAGVLLILFYH